MKRQKILIVSLLLLLIVFFINVPPAEFREYIDSVGTAIKGKIDTIGDTPISSTSAGNYDESILGNEYHYYYSTLSDEDKLIYRQIYYAMQNYPTGVMLATTNGEKVSEIQQYVTLDNPQFFHFERGQYSLGTTLTFTEISNMSDEEIDNAQMAIDNYVSAALSGISNESSEYDKALFIYEYIINNTDYVDNAPYNQNIYSVVKGQTVCQGYAMMYKYLCDQLGIKCIVVTGEADGDPHAWNLACLDGQWCHIDCTYGDSDYLGKNIGYNWFGVNDSIIKNNRTITYESHLPEATSIENDYYYRNGLYLDSYTLKNMQNMCVGQSYMTVKFATSSVYNEACQDLFVNNNSQYLVISKNGGTITYIQEPNSQTIFIRFTLE